MILKSFSYIRFKICGEGGDEGLQTQIETAYPAVITKLEKCFRHVKNKYYHKDGNVFFNPLHIAQWTMFLYEMAHEISRSGNTEVCDKIYGLSKMISSADIFYKVQMPDIWFFDHPQGSVMGRAEYSNFFTFSQCCTVGNNRGVYPKFGKHVSLMSGSKVLGKCTIGDHVIIAANSYVLDEDIPAYSIVFGMHPNISVKRITSDKFNELTESMFNGEDVE